jgi:hypothetical protein
MRDALIQRAFRIALSVETFNATSRAAFVMTLRTAAFGALPSFPLPL